MLKAEEVIAWVDSASGLSQIVSDAKPLPVQSGAPLMQGARGLLTRNWQGTVGAGATVRVHGGADGTPTWTNMCGYTRCIVAVSARLASGTGNVTLRFRTRYLDATGSPVTVWSANNDKTLACSTTETLFVFDVSAEVLAHEVELSLINGSAASCTWALVALFIA